MKIIKDEWGGRYLEITKDSFAHSVNHWGQVFGDWNWINFAFADISFLLDHCVPGWEITFVLLGLGFRVRWNDDLESTEQGAELKRRMDEYKADPEKHGIPLEDLLKK